MGNGKNLPPRTGNSNSPGRSRSRVARPAWPHRDNCTVTARRYVPNFLQSTGRGEGCTASSPVRHPSSEMNRYFWPKKVEVRVRHHKGSNSSSERQGKQILKVAPISVCPLTD